LGISATGGIGSPKSRNIHDPSPTRLRRLLTTSPFIAALALGTAATVSAEPEWDIGAYDDCMSKTARSPEGCCISTGGVITFDGGCQAPPAVQEGSDLQQITPTRQLPTLGDLPTLTSDDPVLMPGQAAG
jgi:hypothetical protein